MMARGSAENLIVYLYNNRKEDSSGEEDDDVQSKKLRGQLNSESQATILLVRKCIQYEQLYEMNHIHELWLWKSSEL